MGSNNVSGPGSFGPREIEMYKKEYAHGADLFQRALKQYSESDNPYQKAEFKSVMDKAMTVLNQAAHELMKKELFKQNEKISHDYDTFQKFPDDPDTLEKLKNDLDQAKKTLS